MSGESIIPPPNTTYITLQSISAYTWIHFCLIKHYHLPISTHSVQPHPSDLDADPYRNGTIQLVMETQWQDQLVQILPENLNLYYATYTNFEVSLDTFWEAHKPYLTVVFIKHGSHLKKTKRPMHFRSTIPDPLTGDKRSCRHLINLQNPTLPLN